MVIEVFEYNPFKSKMRSFATYGENISGTASEVKVVLSAEQARAVIVGLWQMLPPNERPGLTNARD